jgi:hypothetical protein
MQIYIGQYGGNSATNNIAKTSVIFGIRIDRVCLMQGFKGIPDSHIRLYLDVDTEISTYRTHML